MYLECTDADLEHKVMRPLSCARTVAMSAVAAANVYCLRRDYLCWHGRIMINALGALVDEVQRMPGPRA
jgi:hypothetical protein